MGWFWADKASERTADETACPVKRSNRESAFACPVKGSAEVEACPVKGNVTLNPLNNMPDIPSDRAPGQTLVLSTERTVSSIPRGELDNQGNWEYPSPQQMLNAMLRKGKGDGIPEDAVESMVEVHNFLNEGAWNQILDWEQKYTEETKIEPRLKRFTGRPNDLSPRARMYLLLGKIFPDTFNTVPPFDRHDWTVLRSLGKDQGWKEVRYIIDYYGAPDDEVTGMPSFVLDTRPALDSITNAHDRFERWGIPLWKRAMGEFDDK